MITISVIFEIIMILLNGMAARWFVYILFVLLSFYYIKNGGDNSTDVHSKEQYVLCFQLMSIIYCILLVVLCNFRINCLTVLLTSAYIVFSILIRGYVLFQLGMFKNIKFLLRYIVSELLEILAFGLCVRLLPSLTLGEFKELLYDTSAAIYVDILIMTAGFVLLEIPMYTIRNKIWNEFIGCGDE